MKKAALFLAATAALVSVGLASAAPAAARDTPQQQLAKLLAGRVAGKPADCIDTFTNRDSQVIEKTAIVYGSGRTIWVNRPYNADQLDDDVILVTKLHGPQLCSVDVVYLHDRNMGFNRGFVSLGKFVPYTRVASR